MTDSPASQSGGFTLHKLASALRGIPRDAPMLVRLPDGSLHHIDHLQPATVADQNVRPAVAKVGRYAVMLVVSS